MGSEFESKYSLFPGCQKASFSADGPIANDRFEHGDILELEDFGYGVERRLEFFLHIQHDFPEQTKYTKERIGCSINFTLENYTSLALKNRVDVLIKIAIFMNYFHKHPSF